MLFVISLYYLYPLYSKYIINLNIFLINISKININISNQNQYIKLTNILFNNIIYISYFIVYKYLSNIQFNNYIIQYPITIPSKTTIPNINHLLSSPTANHSLSSPSALTVNKLSANSGFLRSPIFADNQIVIRKIVDS